jgi:hypothetical protein
MATHITRRTITSSVMAGAAAIPASSLPAVALTSKIIRCGNRQGRLYGSVCHRTWYPDGDWLFRSSAAGNVTLGYNARNDEIRSTTTSRACASGKHNAGHWLPCAASTLRFLPKVMFDSGLRLQLPNIIGWSLRATAAKRHGFRPAC